MFSRANLYMNLKIFSMIKRFQFFLRRALLFLMVGVLTWNGGLVSAAPIQVPEANELLTRYHQALQQLPAPTQKRYTQQIQTTNWQESSAITDFHFQENGGWEAKIVDNGDRLRQLNSSQVELVDTTDNFRLATTDPEKLAANQIIDLDAKPETYIPIALANKELDGKPVYFLQLKSKSTGLLRELWLDPETALPRKVELNLSEHWGAAKISVKFQRVETYWLPSQTHTEVNMDLAPALSFARIKGLINIDSQYTNYKLGVQAIKPPPSTSPLASTGNVDKKNTSDSFPDSSPSGKTFEAGVSTQKSSSPIADRIAKFNLSKPSYSDPRTNINTFLTLKMGKSNLLMYLVRFNFAGK
jgi:hypothetical protein